MAIPQAFIQELIARTDIVEVVGRYVSLKKGGANFMGLCPFHGEKSPSFTVSPSKQFFHCFGCGKNGNAIGFLMEHAGMGFVEAVKDLAQTYGMQVPEDDSDPMARQHAAQARQHRATLTDVLEQAAQAYRQQLKSHPIAIDYLKGRGLTGAIAKQFGLGYAPDSWRHLATVFPDYQDNLLEESGLVIRSGEEDDGKRYDRFRDRIMFPIRNVKGECIGFGGRIMGEGSPKYLNSPETPVFHKGLELYGLFEARQAMREAGYALVTEGYMDVVALAQLGFANAVATLGTACTFDHVQKLFRFTDAVVFSFDGDAAGQRAARKALESAVPLATDVRSVKFLFLPEEHDPDSFIRAHGPEAFARCVSDALPLSRFMVDVAREGCDIDSAEGRARLASQARPLWAALPAGVLKSQLLAEFADLVRLDERELQRLWVPSGSSKTGAPNASSRPRPSPSGLGSNPRTRTAARAGVRGQITSREDRALQIVFADMNQWASLAQPMQHLMMDLPAPHGPLFSWLDQQWQTVGVQPLAALREGLRNHAEEAGFDRLMANLPLESEIDASELQSITREMEKGHLARQIDELTRRMASDPRAYAQIKALHARLADLKKASVV